MDVPFLVKSLPPSPPPKEAISETVALSTGFARQVGVSPGQGGGLSIPAGPEARVSSGSLKYPGLVVVPLECQSQDRMSKSSF